MIGASYALATPPVVPQLLRGYGAATRTVIAHYLGRDPPDPYLDPLVRDYPARPGKMMRPAICIATARALGAQLDDALPAAAAIEVLHNALLIHDDIEDDSDVRRGLATLHRLHGIAQAINAGDALILKALEPLLDAARRAGPTAARAMLDATRRAARETVAGQALELGWRDSGCIDLCDQDYLLMVLQKTAWMSVILPLQLGVIIGAACGRGRSAAAFRDRIDPDAIVRFGFFVGAAFQVQDDLLNFVADEAYGKEAHGDLYEGKRTLMLLHLWQHGDRSDRAFIVRFLARPRRNRSDAMVARLAGMLESSGAVAHARSVAGALAGAAGHEFDRVFAKVPDSPDKSFLAGLPTWIFERS